MGEVDLADVVPAPRRVRPWLHGGAVALVGACLVAVVAAGRPDEPTSLRSETVPTSGPSSPPVSVDSTPDSSVVIGSVAPVTADAGPPPLTVAPIVAVVTSTTSIPSATTTVPPVDVGARPVPPAQPVEPPPGPATAYPTTTSPAGHVVTDVGCASGTSAAALDAFFRARIGPLIGEDYQHVYPLGGDRWLWLFQDTFIDHTGQAIRFDQASFAHNVALVQQGRCFTVLHRGTAAAPLAFEPGDGDRTLSRWFWPLGGELSGGRLRVFWAEMAKTADPPPPDGLGWVPARTWLATYDATTLARTSFRPAPAPGVSPIYGFAVSSDAEHTYLFGNSFDQNLARQGGYHACPCSASAVYLARVPRGALDAAPQYRAADGWTADPGAAVPIVDRYHAENPMQPRFLDGRWVAVTKVDGYWGDDLAIDVANQPWGPWTTVSRRGLPPRGGDALMNTYHAHLMPWSDGGLVVSVSQNARDMARHAWPHPERYRLQFLSNAMPEGPPDPVATTTTTAVVATTTTTTTVVDTTTTLAATTTTEASTTTVAETTTTTSSTCPTTTVAAATSTTAVSTTSSTQPSDAPPTTVC